MQLIPAILTDSFQVVQDQINQVKESGQVESIQIDVIDGLFADDLTVTPLDLTVGDFEPLKLDFHFMTEEPMDFVYECAGLKEYLPIRQIIGQVERMTNQRDFIDEVKRNGWEPVLALDIYTPLEAIDEDVWPELRTVLLMSVEAGAQNQQFKPIVLEKIREIRRVYPTTAQMKIVVDGGIKPAQVAELIEAGADELAVGSAIWTSVDPLAKIDEFYDRL